MAINFPSTTGQPTNGTYTHSSGGVTWAWDGTTWLCKGVTGTYSLPPATASTLGGIKVGTNLTVAADGTLAAVTGASINCFSNIAVSGYDSVVADSNSDTLTLVAGSGISIATTPGTDSITITNTAQGGGGTGSSLQTRTTAQATTASISNGTAVDMTISAAKTYALLKVQTSHAAWVTLYADAASRTADSGRTETQDPTPGSGVLAEVITGGAVTQLITPGTFGWNNDSTPSSNVYLKVVNKSGSAAAITVTLTYVQLEG